MNDIKNLQFGGVLVVIRVLFILVLFSNLILAFIGFSVIYQDGPTLDNLTNALLYTSVINSICSIIILNNISTPEILSKKKIIYSIVVLTSMAAINGINQYLRSEPADVMDKIVFPLLFTLTIAVILIGYFLRSKRATSFYIN